MVDSREPEYENYTVAQSIVIDMPRADIDNLTHRLHDVDLVEVQETLGTRILPSNQLLRYLNES